MFSRTTRRVIPVAMVVTAGLALTACGSGDGTSSAAASSSSSSSPSSASSTGSSSTTDPSTTSGSTAGASTAPSTPPPTPTAAANGGPIPACATSDLATTAESFTGGTGHITFQIVFQNTSSEPCGLTGYPGVSFVKAQNTQLGKAASRTSGTASTVTLIPNAHAYADAQTINGDGGYSAAKCDLTTVPTLRVYPPNQKESTNIPWNRQECVGSTIQNLQVGPVHATM